MYGRILIYIVIVSLSSMLSGCDEAIIFVWDDLDISTDKTTYFPDEQIVVTVANHTDFNVHIKMCVGELFDHYIEKQIEGRWEIVGGPACPDGLDFQTLEPGQSRSAALLFSVSSEVPGGIEGIYRIKLLLYETIGEEYRQLPEKFNISNTFTVFERE